MDNTKGSEMDTSPAKVAQKTNGKGKCLLFVLFGLCLLVLVSCICTSGVYLASRGENGDDNEIENQKQENDSDNNDFENDLGGSSYVPSTEVDFDYDYQYKSVPSGVEAYDRPQLELLLDAVTLAESKGWNGENDGSLNFSYKDFDESRLEDYAKRFKNYQSSEKGIQSDRRDLYYGSQAKSDIEKVIWDAREEYLKFLGAQGIADKYIKEIDEYVFTTSDENVEYVIDKGGSLVDGYNRTDYTRRQMKIDGTDVNKVMNDLVTAEVFGPIPSGSAKEAKIREYRDASVRMVIYHEMTHILQQAYVNLHITSEQKATGSRQLWKDATKTLIDIDKSLYWEWFDNRIISEESQAEGIMMLVMYDHYDMSEDQQTKLWNQWIGRENNNAELVHKIGVVFHKNFPSYLKVHIQSFGDKVYEEAFDGYKGDKSEVEAMLGYSDRLAAYWGYFNPVTEEQAELIWDALKD